MITIKNWQGLVFDYLCMLANQNGKRISEVIYALQEIGFYFGESSASRFSNSKNYTKKYREALKEGRKSPARSRGSLVHIRSGTARGEKEAIDKVLELIMSMIRDEPTALEGLIKYCKENGIDYHEFTGDKETFTEIARDMLNVSLFRTWNEAIKPTNTASDNISKNSSKDKADGGEAIQNRNTAVSFSNVNCKPLAVSLDSEQLIGFFVQALASLYNAGKIGIKTDGTLLVSPPLLESSGKTPVSGSYGFTSNTTLGISHTVSKRN